MAATLPNFGLFTAVAIVALGSCLQCGYISSVLNIPQSQMEKFVNQSHIKIAGRALSPPAATWLWSAIVTMRGLGQMSACALCPTVSGLLGRKRTIMANCITLSVGLTLQFISGFVWLWPMLLTGRYIWAIGVGFSEIMAPIFFSEISPRALRGAMSSVHGTVGLGLGALLSLCLGLPAALLDASLWPFAYLLPLVTALLQLLALFYLPDSPKDLYNRYGEKACRPSLEFYHGRSAPLDKTIDEYASEAAEQKGSASSLWAVVRNPRLRMSLFVGTLSTLSYSFGGMPVITTYTVQICTAAGVARKVAVYCALALGALRFLGGLPAVFVLERFGRRSVLLSCAWVCVLCHAACMAAQFAFTARPDWGWPKALCIAAVLCYAAFFSLGVQTCGTFLPTELVPTGDRSATQTFAVWIRFIFDIVLSMLWLPLQRSVGAYAWLELLVPLCIVSMLLSYCMPETKNRPINEILHSLNHEHALPCLANKQAGLGSAHSREASKAAAAAGLHPVG